jgi:hypothetical protein
MPVQRDGPHLVIRNSGWIESGALRKVARASDLLIPVVSEPSAKLLQQRGTHRCVSARRGCVVRV